MGKKVRENQQTFWEKAKRFFEPLKSNKLITLYFIIYFAFELIFWVVFIFLIQDATSTLESMDKNQFYNVLLSYGTIIFLLFMGTFICHRFWIYSYNRYRSTIESRYFPVYISMDMNSYEKIGTGKSIAIISKGIKVWWMLLDNSLMNAMSFFVSVGLTLYLLSQVSFVMVYLLIFLLIGGIFLWIYLNSWVVHHRKKRIELDNMWSKHVVKIIMAKMEILQSWKIYGEVQKLHDLHEGQIYYNKKMAIFLVPYFVLWIWISGILLFSLFLYFGEKYLSGDINLWVIAGLAGAIMMMQTVFTRSLDFIKNFSKDFAEVQNLWDFFDTTPQIQWYEEWNMFIHKKWDIELKNITYGYDENNPVFQNFSVKIQWEKVTALVWPSGGGKSTLVKLIAGYIRLDSGEVIIDGQKLSETALKSYYKDIGYLTQEPSVFDGTIRENLMYAVSEKDIWEKQLKKIIQQANCEFIYDLPKWLDTEIWERWVKLSGWQKQRLAIAKIFLKNPKIIILDEPTSALDSVSEKKISQALYTLFQNRTVLVIAHRLQTVKHADDILVIENGNIRERGTHKELIAEKWFYKQMLDLQSGF